MNLPSLNFALSIESSFLTDPIPPPENKKIKKNSHADTRTHPPPTPTPTPAFCHGYNVLNPTEKKHQQKKGKGGMYFEQYSWKPEISSLKVQSFILALSAIATKLYLLLG